MEDRKAIGVITRTDLMRIMHEKMVQAEGVDYRTTQKKNIQSLLEDRLPRQVNMLLHEAGTLAASMGFNIYLVGGIVRDMLLRIDNLDIDLVVEGDGIAFAKTLTQSLGARCAVHEKYKTAVITLSDGTHIDVATARLEYYKHPGGYPIVEQSTLKLDLYRRDFTINTMAVYLNPQRFGELIDFFGAQRDIKEKHIRVLHALSFVEDPSRIFRAVRFEKRYGFALGKQTLSLVHAAVKSGLLSNIPGRRILHEIRQILSEDDPLPSLDRLRELEVLTAIHPDIVFNTAIKDDFARVKQTISWFNLLYTHEDYRPWFIYLLALVEHMKPKKIIAICSRLGLTDENMRNILTARARVNAILKGADHAPEELALFCGERVRKGDSGGDALCHVQDQGRRDQGDDLLLYHHLALLQAPGYGQGPDGHRVQEGQATGGSLTAHPRQGPKRGDQGFHGGHGLRREMPC